MQRALLSRLSAGQPVDVQQAAPEHPGFAASRLAWLFPCRVNGEAIAALGLEDRFAALPEGLDTEVRERGTRLSAGERQLVSLVRAALADPSLLVLDEATSSLDPGTERTVERALGHLTEGRTVVVVAHRLSTAARADRIAVVDDGCIAELGTHDDLIAHEGRYASLYAAWDSRAAMGRAS